MNTIVTAASGTEYSLGPVALTTTVREVKERLAQVSEMSVGSQTLFNMEDGRGEEGEGDGEGNVDGRLRDAETMDQVRRYGKGWKEEEQQGQGVEANGDVDGGGGVGGGGGAGEVLKLYVVVGTGGDACEWVRGMAAMGVGAEALSARIGDGTEGHGDHQLNYPLGIATVPVHPHLMVVTASDSHQVRVYDTRGGGSGSSSSRLVCKMGREDGRKGQGEGEFNGPWGVVVTADSAYVIVAEFLGGRLQVLSLVVDAEGTTAELGFVREIGKGQLRGPLGLALRSVGGVQTVLVAEGGGGDQVTEWGLEDGSKVGTIGTGKGGRGDGELDNPFDVAVVPTSGQIAIADTFNHRVCIFDGESGTFVRAFGSKGKEEDGHFSYPVAIAADSHGHVLVLDKCTDRLQVLGADGTHLCTRNGLGIYNKGNSSKGLEWREEGGGGRLAIANGKGHDTLVFGWA